MATVHQTITPFQIWKKAKAKTPMSATLAIPIYVCTIITTNIDFLSRNTQAIKEQVSVQTNRLSVNKMNKAIDIDIDIVSDVSYICVLDLEATCWYPKKK